MFYASLVDGLGKAVREFEDADNLFEEMFKCSRFILL